MNALFEWYQLSEKLKTLKKQELEMRKALFANNFPEPEEGTNHVAVQGGTLVATYPFTHALDEDSLEAGLEHVPVTKREKLIVYKPTLVKAVYNKLSATAKKKFTAECITITSGTPSLKIVPDEPEA